MLYCCSLFESFAMHGCNWKNHSELYIFITPKHTALPRLLYDLIYVTSLTNFITLTFEKIPNNNWLSTKFKKSSYKTLYMYIILALFCSLCLIRDQFFHVYLFLKWLKIKALLWNNFRFTVLSSPVGITGTFKKSDVSTLTRNTL